MKKMRATFLIFSLFTILYPGESSAGVDRRLWLAVLGKSLLTTGTALPFGISASSVYIGGFSNFSAQSTGDYQKDVEKGQFGFGGLLGYKHTLVDFEASVRTLKFDNNVNVQTQDQPSSSESLVYGLGIRKAFWSFLTIKLGWALHEIKSVAQDLATGEGDIAKQYEDNGFYYGGGIRFPFLGGSKLYMDATAYKLKGLSTNIVDSELGLLYFF